MAITRYENLTVNSLSFTTDSYGQQVTTQTTWFQTRGLVKSVKNSLNITKDDRVYNDLVNITLNYTPNTKQIVDSQNLYSIHWRDADWRITNALETDDRMNVILMCYRNDPVVSV